MEIAHFTENTMALDDTKSFVEAQAPPTGSAARNIYAYRIEGPKGQVIAVREGTNVAPEFRDEHGDKLDGSTRVIIQKADTQGNPLGDGVVFNATLSDFDYEKMRTDPDYFRRTDRSLMIDEREIVKIFVVVPQGETPLDPEQSRLKIGDNTSSFGKPVHIAEREDIPDEHLRMIDAANQHSANGGN